MKFLDQLNARIAVQKYGVKGMKHGVKKPKPDPLFHDDKPAAKPVAAAPAVPVANKLPDAAKPAADKPVEASDPNHYSQWKDSDASGHGFTPERLNKFVDGLHAKNKEYQQKMGGHDAYKTNYTVEHGKKYAKIVSSDSNGSSKSVHSFIDKTNGNVLKANSWKAPHHIPRGNIGDGNFGLKAVGVHGANYLK